MYYVNAFNKNLIPPDPLLYSTIGPCSLTDLICVISIIERTLTVQDLQLHVILLS